MLAAWSFAASADQGPAIAAEVSLAPLPEKQDVYEAVAIVSVADGGAFLAAPFLRFNRGETAVTSTAAEPGGTVSLSIGPVFRGIRANWLVVWRREDGEVVARARGIVTVESAD